MYDREEYEWYKTHGICVRCRKAKARRGRTTCAACAAQNTERTLRYFNELAAERQPPDLCAVQQQAHSRTAETGGKVTTALRCCDGRQQLPEKQPPK